VRHALVLLLAGVALGCAVSARAAPPDHSAWELVFEDEFDGDALDATKWALRTGPRRDGYWEASAVSLNGAGHLVIRTFRDGERVVTGAVETRGKFEQRYGYWEIRCQLQREQGHWTAFWLQSPDFGKTLDPRVTGAEIDIFEYHANWGDRVQHAVHYGNYAASPRSVQSTPRVPVRAGFHTFGLEWTPDEYVFYVDGRETWRTATGVSRRAQFAIVSSEIGKWAGDIARARLPDDFVVDYVRVYRLAESPPGQAGAGSGAGAGK